MADALWLVCGGVQGLEWSVWVICTYPTQERAEEHLKLLEEALQNHHQTNPVARHWINPYDPNRKIPYRAVAYYILRVPTARHVDEFLEGGGGCRTTRFR